MMADKKNLLNVTHLRSTKSSSLNDLSHKKHYAPIAPPRTLSKDSNDSSVSASSDGDLTANNRHSDSILEDSYGKAILASVDDSKIHSLGVIGDIISLLKKSPKFARKQFQDSNSSRTEFVILPVDLYRNCEFECHRILEYEQYLSNLLEKTDETQTDYQNLKEAIDQIRKIVCGSYQNVKEQSENNNDYSNIQLEKDKIAEHVQKRRKSTPGAVLFKNLGSAKTRFSWMSGDKGLEHDVTNFARYQSNIKRLYIMETAVQLTNCEQTHERYLFLFDDVLLVAKQKSHNQFKLKHYVHLCEMWLSSWVDEARSFIIGWPVLSNIVTFASEDLKEKWKIKLKELIDEKKKCEEPKEIPIIIQSPDQKQPIRMLVQNAMPVKEVVKKCLVQLQMSEVDIDDYELRTEYGDNDSNPYLLMGYEIPYNIKMNQIRNSCECKDVRDNNDETKIKYDFLLMLSKKTPKKQNSDDVDWKGGKKNRNPFHLFKRTAKVEEKPLKKLFGQPLQDVTENDRPPKPIDDLLQILFHKGPTIKGIFRTPANAKKKRELCEMLDNAEDANMAEVNEKLAAAVLMILTWPIVEGGVEKNITTAKEQFLQSTLFKKYFFQRGISLEYLRSIPQGLLMEDKYPDWLETGRLLNDTEKLAKIQSLVGDLLPGNRRLLQQLMCVFYFINKKSSENLMSAPNLATCISPSLLGSKQPERPNDLALIMDVVTYMIENYQQIFGEDVHSLFPSAPPERIQDDSDTDSFHSNLSIQETGGLQQSDNSSLDRDLSNAETESSNSRLSPISKVTSDRLSDQEFGFTEPQYPREHATNMDEKIRFRKKSPYKNDSQESEDSTGSLASNSSTRPIPPPRKHRQNLVSKHMSMTSIDNMAPLLHTKRESSSQSENDLHSCTPNLPRDSRKFPVYVSKNVHSMQANRKPIIMIAECPSSIVATTKPHDKSGEEELQFISRNYNHEESLNRDQSRVIHENPGRVMLLDATEEQEQKLVSQHHFQHQQKQQQNYRHPHVSERKHLPLAPRNSYPSTPKTEIQNETEIRLALFHNENNPDSTKKSSMESSPRLSYDRIQRNFPLSPPPCVLLQNIKPRVNAGRNKLNSTKPGRNLTTHDEEFSKESVSTEELGTNPTSNFGKNPMTYDVQLVTSSPKTKKLVRSERIPLDYRIEEQPEKRLLLKEMPNINMEGSYSSPPPDSVGVPRRPKQPPSYKEAMDQKYRQQQRSSFAENLYMESLKEFDNGSNDGSLKIPQPEVSVPNLMKRFDPKLNKANKKNALNKNNNCSNNSSRTNNDTTTTTTTTTAAAAAAADNNNNNVTFRKVLQDNQKKNRRKTMLPNEISSSNRLQGNLSKSESNLNFLCSDDESKSVEKRLRVVGAKSQHRTESYTEPSRRTSKTTETKQNQEKGQRNGNNSNYVSRKKSLTKTQSSDFGANQERTMKPSNRNSKELVLPWSVSEMIGKFATSNTEPSHLRNHIK